MSPTSPISFNVAEAENGQKFVTVFANGVLSPPADDSHPNFKTIVGLCEAAFRGESVDPQSLLDLFDVAATVEREFKRISERVAVKDGVITLDGDPVHGTLQDQILDFVDRGEDFTSLVNFYEKLLTNPLGDVRQGLYDWIVGQRANGNFTITPEGNILGYKAFNERSASWRKDVKGSTVYTPSRTSRNGDLVNGQEVPSDQYAEQVPGDIIEMPRSKTPNTPSAECGVGLHIGTYQYASTFLGNGAVMLVEFSPRDIVSLPDRNSSWKLRVCRYKNVKLVDGPLNVPVYLTKKPLRDSQDAEETVEQTDAERLAAGTDPDLDVTLGSEQPLVVGDRVVDADGDEGVIEQAEDEDGDVLIKYDNADFGTEYASAATTQRVHGKGGATSQAAKGRGRNPAQDDSGRFSNGRPGSARSGSNGRFVKQS